VKYEGDHGVGLHPKTLNDAFVEKNIQRSRIRTEDQIEMKCERYRRLKHKGNTVEEITLT
jgi:hypothetical protein